jgi:ribosomal-protein-alanine N-acetyltransferase
MTFSIVVPQIVLSNITMRPLELADSHQMFDYASDPEVTRHVTWETHHTEDDSLIFLRDIIHGYERGDTFVWGIIWNDTNALVGTIALHHWSPKDQVAELGYALGRRYWGNGIATMAAGAILDFGFSSLNLNRIYALCHIQNARSARVLEKIGMQKEGELREYYKVKGDLWTVWIYAILARDWNVRLLNSKLSL